MTAVRLHVAVAGAGIAGASVVRSLAQLGCRRITLVARPRRGGGRRGPQDSGATGRGAGILSAQFWDAVLAPHALASLRIVEGLAAAGRLRVRGAGMAQIALKEGSAALLARLVRVRRSLGAPVAEALPSALTSVLRPAFVRRMLAGTWAADDLWVRPADLVGALVHAAGRSVTARLGVLRTVERRVGGGVSLRGAWGRIDADVLVDARGAAGSTDWPGPGGHGRVDRVRSQTVRLSDVGAPAMLHVLDTGIYLRPDGPTSVVIGNGEEAWTGDPDACPAGAGRGFASRAERSYRALFGGSPRADRGVSGVCARTPDGRPLAGPVDPDRRIWILGGFGGDGLALAPSLGEAVAAHVLGRRGAPDLAPFAVAPSPRRR